jgi:hypothetical protein
MKMYRLLCLAAVLLPLLFSCGEAPEDEVMYDEAPPFSVAISDLTGGGFAPGGRIYISFYRLGGVWSSWEDVEPNKIGQGNAIVGEDGTAVISLHFPTGIPYKLNWDEYSTDRPATVFILRDNKSDERLRRADININNAANISLSFASDFVPADKEQAHSSLGAPAMP